jgi:effector-binding domain-containing protein
MPPLTGRVFRITESQSLGRLTVPLKPTIINREARRYVAIRQRAQRESLGEVVPNLFYEVSEWLATNGLVATGPPLVRYLMVDYNSGEVEIDAGAPVESAAPNGGRVRTGEIPGGRYATLIHQGPYVSLMETTAELLTWGRENNIKWQVDEESKVTRWGGRIESYLVGPPESPDPKAWRTEVVILIAGL